MILDVIAIILFFGFLIVYFLKKHSIPAPIFLILGGVLLKNFIIIPSSFLDNIIIFLFSIFVFGSTALLTIHLDTYEEYGAKLALFNMVFNVLFLGPIAFFLLKLSVIESIFFSLIVSLANFSALIYHKKHQILDIIKGEEILNPLVISLLFILMNFIKKPEGLFQNILLGLGSGLFLGIIVLGLKRVRYHKYLSPIFLLISIILCYYLANFLNGNPALALLAYGMLFSKAHLQNKDELMKFLEKFSLYMEIFVFFIIGLIFELLVEYNIIFKVFIIFLIFLILRAFSIILTFLNEESRVDKLFLTLKCAKGAIIITFVLYFSEISLYSYNILILFAIMTLFSSSLASLLHLHKTN